MEINLRPLTLGEILDRTAQLYRENFWLFAGIAAVYSGALLVLNLIQIGIQEYLRLQHLSQYLLLLTGIAVIITFFIMFVFGGLAVAANNRAVAWVHLGEPATIRGAYAGILPHAGRYLGLMTIVTFVLWTPLALAYGGYIAAIYFWIRPLSHGARNVVANTAALAGNQASTVVGVTLAFVVVCLLGLAYAILMGLRYALAIAACVVENLPARQALRRSIDLSKGSRGRIFVLGLLVMVIQMGLVMITQMAFIVLSFKQHGQLAAGARVLQQFVAFVTNTFVGPMYATGLTLFYYDQRVRKEGYDIEWMMRAAGLIPPAAASTPDQPSQIEEAPEPSFPQPPEVETRRCSSP